MMTFVQGDTAPDLNAILHDKDDEAAVLDLTDCTVRFQMRKADDRRFTVNNEADIIVAVDGSVRYQWGPNDLAVPGDYLTQWEVTYSDDRLQTTELPETITIRRQ
jgi:hypothetical protein